MTKVIIRLGSHAEKEYIEKTSKDLDGMILGANLLEATVGATTSLVIKLSAKRKTPIFLDPMTYAFGSYIDPNTNGVRTDLDWIKSDQVVKGTGSKNGGPKQIVRDYKRSYRAIAEALGGVFLRAIIKNQSLSPQDFTSNEVLENTAKSVIGYQRNRFKQELQKDSELRSFSDRVPEPSAIFAPYFYVEPSKAKEWLALNIKFANVSVSLFPELPIHAIVCVDRGFLSNDAAISDLILALQRSNLHGVWFWFSKLLEDDADDKTLSVMRKLVSEISEKKEVYNLHGGYYSLALSLFGLKGISHGIGYGEQKDVVPIIGQSTPTVRYYLPPLHIRVGVPEIERSLKDLGIDTPEQYYDSICDCTVCRGVIGADLANLREFGDMHYSTPMSKRMAQTPAAAKRCRYHFLLRRYKERDRISNATKDEVVDDIKTAYVKWQNAGGIPDKFKVHLTRWMSALK